MGRWTVAEWLAQAQEHSPLPIGEDECGDGTYHYIDTLVEEDDDDFEDDEEEDDHEKPLPARPKLLLHTRDLPPIPPPKIASARSPAAAVRAGHSSSGPPKMSRRTRGKRGKADVAPAYASENPDRCMPDDDCHSPHEGLLPRSPDTRRPLEFLARSGVRRAPSKSKSKPKTAFGRDQYSYSGQALQIFVSTQVTATHSAHDAGRPRVFYPRSSSLPSAATNGLPPPPYKPSPPGKTLNVTPHSWSSRALPALPVASATDAPPNSVHPQASTDSGLASSDGSRRIRPLPVPRLPP